ncbi:ATP-binding protein [Xanthomonas sp. NCPPB 2632]|uniref:ATP-binding protein n=1 Tax=Xanthomonas sp. NCPPB 2632 TaxID=3240912 RepID=UPI003516E768
MKHPVEANDYLIATKPIGEYANWCVALIESGMPGKAMTSAYRMGKSRATRWVVSNKTALLHEDVPIFILPQRFHSSITPKKLFSHILEATGHPLRSGDESVLRSRIIVQLGEMTEHMDRKRVVMFVDEAQWLNRLAYHLLINLANELDVIGIRLIVILVASPELDGIIARYRTLKRGHIVGRFMSDVTHLNGIDSAGTLAHAWSQYDTKQIFPEGSGISFTRAFAGDRFSAGLTMHSLAQNAWDVMEQVFRQSGGTGVLSLPMQAVTLVANEVLLRVVGLLDPPYLIGSDTWANILDQVGFMEQMALVQMTQADK